MNTIGPQPQGRVPWWAILIAPVMMLLTLGSGGLAVAAFERVSDQLVSIVAAVVAVGASATCGVFLDWLVERERAHNLHPRCPRCDYDLHALLEPRCPECGQTWTVQPSTKQESKKGDGSIFR